ncbi:MAG: M28 family peptidase [Gemmatimonadales bacterium]
MKIRLVAAIILAVPAGLASQTGAKPDLKPAAARITEAEIRRQIEIIAHDSMGGRDTPSPGLEKTAEWLAREFARYGLKPGGDSGTYLQRYEVNVAEQDPDSAFLELSIPGSAPGRLVIGPDVRIEGVAPRTATQYDVVLLGGKTLDPGAIKAEAVRGKLAILVTDWTGGMGPQIQEAAVTAVTRGALGVLLPINNDSLAEQMGLGTPIAPTARLGPPRPAAPSNGRFFALTSDAALARALPGVAQQVAFLRSAPRTTVAPVVDWRATVVSKESVGRSVMVPNTVGILEGTDPKLRNEYLVITAHMDHVGSSCGGSTPEDRVCNGADDDASGTVGLVELAKAFEQARPARSVIFVAVSGEEKGLWGSAHFAERPPVPISAMVANLNMDMIGRNWKDSVVAVGKPHSSLGTLVDRIAAEHPELGMTVVDDLWPDENLFMRSDHYSFVRKGVPALFFTSGLHGDYHAVSDTPDKIDAEKQTRILQLMFYLGHEIATAPERPVWDQASYQRIVRPAGQP